MSDQCINLNPHLKKMKVDTFYHLGFDTSMDLSRFSDVKFVLMMGTRKRARAVAEQLVASHGFQADPEYGLNPAGCADRFEMFKVGPVICVSHGLGNASLSILLHEITKLLAASGAHGATYIRLGTCGGLGLNPGTVVVSRGAVSDDLEPAYTLNVMGKSVRRACHLDAELGSAIRQCGLEIGIKSVMGKTMGSQTFYEGQGRIDGAICENSEAEQD
eukprot:265702_1